VVPSVNVLLVGVHGAVTEVVLVVVPDVVLVVVPDVVVPDVVVVDGVLLSSF
jgi:hypothetical protein